MEFGNERYVGRAFDFDGITKFTELTELTELGKR
jgi:hypothetical protein